MLEDHPELRIVNREEDLNDLGLRESKMSYLPIGFIKKYHGIFEILNTCRIVALRNDKDHSVRNYVETRARHHEVKLFRIDLRVSLDIELIHLLLSGGNKDVAGSALLYLCL